MENNNDPKKWAFTIKTSGGTYINVPKSAAIAIGVTSAVLIGALVGAKVIKGF